MARPAHKLPLDGEACDGYTDAVDRVFEEVGEWWKQQASVSKPVQKETGTARRKREERPKFGRQVGRLFVWGTGDCYRIYRRDGRALTSPFATKEAAIRAAGIMQGALKRCALHHCHAGEHMFVKTTSDMLLSGECPAMEVNGVRF